MTDRSELLWWKSTRSASGACDEVAVEAGSVLMRDSKDPDGPVLTFDLATFRAFVAGVKQS
ncbi:DUF397 domain-containing protein [Actinoplanes sp. NPDC051494]|uniref:DUF397 domain-containing protein n=1 Tax=Actinoplanes sp. NPDC051494 TaxID=3363907 RepID=UPI0037B14A46